MFPKQLNCLPVYKTLPYNAAKTLVPLGAPKAIPLYIFFLFEQS